MMISSLIHDWYIHSIMQSSYRYSHMQTPYHLSIGTILAYTNYSPTIYWHSSCTPAIIMPTYFSISRHTKVRYIKPLGSYPLCDFTMGRTSTNTLTSVINLRYINNIFLSKSRLYSLLTPLSSISYVYVITEINNC